MMTVGDAHEDLFRDRDLLTRLRAGDPAAFDTIYLRYYARLATFAKRIAHDAEPAADIVHDVFLSLWEHRTTRVIVPPLAAYLYGAVRNRAISARRRLDTAERNATQFVAAQLTPGAGTLAGDPEQRFEASQARAALRAAIDTLPERQQLALRLHLDEQLAPAAIAAVLHIHEQVVRKLLAKAMKKLSAVLEATER